MSLAYFGSQGTYFGDSNQYQYQMQNSMNIYASNTQATNTATVYGGLLGGLGYAGLTSAGLVNQMATIQNIAPPEPQQSLTDFMKKVSKPAKEKAKGILAKLRAEIDDWHADVLERCPA